MGDSAGMFGNSGDTDVLELTGKIMVVAIILLFFVAVFVFCLHVYAKWFWHRRQENATTTSQRRRRRRLDFAAGHLEVTVITARPGLDPAMLKTIPVVVFDAKEFKEGLECAVCLCEISDGEKARLLPKCKHGFHVECIDMWFQSHSTCPLCRNPVSNSSQSSSNSVTTESTLENILQTPTGENSGVNGTDVPSFPANVLFWGNETQISILGPGLEDGSGISTTATSSQTPSSSSSSSSSSQSTSNRLDGMMVIDIPRQFNEEEEQKSPVPTRLRSLKRLLSGNKRINPCSPRNGDL
ncbi:RING-H2 finger ATL3-like [Olea europaea subsp. europaea]|uniref:RING-type E3 ubiquitin transferase n=1 Tax=Olea europaea subsp. europaea TaxID=158383 RepID=A0A8S0TDM2_OLEEU|nr:RING-H2 finger ATL3-like [Olea europaea subsp. europaea]